MKLDELGLQNKALTLLKVLLQTNRIPQVLLFHGPVGTGKRTHARAFARELLHRYSSMKERSDFKLDRDTHPDLRCYQVDAKSQTFPIQKVRELIQDIDLAPFESSCKVFILEDIEKMLASGGNLLLKSLEEPPLDTYVLLISSSKDTVLPTIQSRCLKVPFFELSMQTVQAFLMKELGLDEKQAELRARFSRGSLTKAKRIHNDAFRETLFKLLASFCNVSFLTLSEIFSLIGEFVGVLEKQEDEALYVEDALELMALFFRDMLAYSTFKDPQMILFNELLKDPIIQDTLPLEEALKRLELIKKGYFHHIKMKTLLEDFVIVLKRDLSKHFTA